MEQPQPRSDPGARFRRILRVLVVAAVIGAGVFLLVRVAPFGGDDGGPSPEAPPGASVSPAAVERLPMEEGASATIIGGYDGDQQSLVALGEVLDDFEHPSNQFSLPGPGNRWWGIYLTVENTGEADAVALRYKLRLADDSEYDPRFIAGVPDMLEYSYSDLTPDARKRGWMFFEIPEDGVVGALRVDARNGSGGQPSVPVYFEAR